MVTYNLIKQIENSENFLFLLKKGIIPLSILDRKVYYEKYLSEVKTQTNSQAIINTAEDYNVSESTIRRAILFMEN